MLHDARRASAASSTCRFGGPAANYWGGDRPGANLFANSIVAVDAETGKYKWHFQTVHHDIWDFDMPSPPVLVDIMQNGRRVPALASVGKTGYMFILDRVTGKPIFGVEERPVPKGDVPGRVVFADAAVSGQAGRRSRESTFNKERDMVRPEDTSAQHVAECQALWDKSGGFYNAGPFTPFLFHEDGAPPQQHDSVSRRHRRRELGRPGRRSAIGLRLRQRARHVARRLDREEEAGAELRPQHRRIDAAVRSRQRQRPRAVLHFHARRSKTTTGRTVANLPCQRPPWARLVAVNANTGEIAWQMPLGLNEALPEGKQLTGGSGSAGPSVTAGGLVFVGATNDRRLRAFDAKTGKELWSRQARRLRSTRTR